MGGLGAGGKGKKGENMAGCMGIVYVYPEYPNTQPGAKNMAPHPRDGLAVSNGIPHTLCRDAHL